MPIQKIETEAIAPDRNYFPIPFNFITPSVTAYTAPNLKIDFIIEGIDVKTSTGTLDLKIKIGSTDVVWDSTGSTIEVTNSNQMDDGASANTFASGDNLVFDVSNLGSSPTKLEGTLHCRYV